MGILGRSQDRVLTECLLVFQLCLSICWFIKVCAVGWGRGHSLVSFIFNKCPWIGRSSAPARSGMYKSFALKCPWLGKTRPCDSVAGCKLLRSPGFVWLFCLSFPFHLPRNFHSFSVPCLPQFNILDLVYWFLCGSPEVVPHPLNFLKMGVGSKCLLRFSFGFLKTAL